MASITKRRPLFLFGVFSLVVLAMGCAEQDEWSVPHSLGTSLSAARPECPQWWDRVPLFGVAGFVDNVGNFDSVVTDGVQIARDSAGSGGSALLGATGPGLSGPITNVPEFHDCQKFLTLDSNGAPKYDSLYAIFAAFKLDSIAAAARFDAVKFTSSKPVYAKVDGDGMVTAMAAGSATITAASIIHPGVKATVNITVQVAPVAAPTTVTVSSTTPGSATLGVGQQIRILPTAPTTSTLPVAEIYTYGNGYPPLGIKQNFNCLYLFYDEKLILRAKMVPVPHLGAQWNACANAVDPRTAVGDTLVVVQTPGGSYDDYPAAARWDWDPVNKQQYVGIKCGAAWCEIGQRGPNGPFTPSRTHDVVEATSDQGRVARIKGWYDEQFLALSDDAGHATPTGLRGTVIPDPDLGGQDDAAFNAHRWIRVAYIALGAGTDNTPGVVLAGSNTAPTSVAIGYYKKKFNLDTVSVRTPLTTMNQLALCYGTRSTCGVPDSPAGPAACKSLTNQFGQHKSRWWSRIISATAHDTTYRCTTRRDHTSTGLPSTTIIPATARWRWLAADETTWNACTQGCCEVEVMK